MKAGKFAVWGLGGSVVLAALYVWAFTVAVREPLWRHGWIREVYRAKEQIARETPSPRWLVLGGSSAWFGFQHDVLEAATGQRVVNLGIHAELPLFFQLWQAERLARPGDTVLLAEEMVHFRREKISTFATTEIEQAAPGFFWQVPLRRKGEMLVSVPPWRVLAGLIVRLAHGTKVYAQDFAPPPAARLMENLRARWAGTYTGAVPLYYNYLELDDRGEFARLRTTAEHPHDTYHLDEAPVSGEPRWAEDLRATAARLRARGVRCLFTWQPFEQQAGVDYAAERAQANFASVRAILEAAGWREVGRPEDSIFGPDCFFDTPYHLTTEGARLRTERLVQRLRERELLAPPRGN